MVQRDTWSADPVLVQYVMAPYWLSCLSIHHRAHDLVERLVCVTFQHQFLVAVYQATTKAFKTEHKNKFNNETRLGFSEIFKAKYFQELLSQRKENVFLKKSSV